jgi:hypothetical protein
VNSDALKVKQSLFSSVILSLVTNSAKPYQIHIQYSPNTRKYCGQLSLLSASTSKVSPEQRTRVQMSPEAQNDIKMHVYDFYQINLYDFTQQNLTKYTHPILTEYSP